MAANLTQILNFKVNFHQEFQLFSTKKFMPTIIMVDTFNFNIIYCQHNKKTLNCSHKTYDDKTL